MGFTWCCILQDGCPWPILLCHLAHVQNKKQKGNKRKPENKEAWSKSKQKNKRENDKGIKKIQVPDARCTNTVH